MLRADKSKEATEGADAGGGGGGGGSGRLGRAALPFLQSVMPLAYDLVVVVSALIYMQHLPSRRDRLL